MAQSNLEIVISARDGFTATANRVIGGLNRMNSSAGRVGKGLGQVGAGLAKVGLIAGTAAAGGLIGAAKAGADFEAQLRTINTIARQDTEGLDEIGQGIRALAREGRGDLGDLSEAFYDVLSAGITDSSEAMSVLDAASRLSIGGLASNAQAVDLLTTALNAYGEKATGALKNADMFAKAIEIGKVTADEIAASFANVAPIAAQVGINLEEIAAAYGALTAQGTPAAEVATQMQRAIVELLSPNKELRGLQKDLGVSFLQIAQEKGLVVALQSMRDAVNDDEAAFKELFGRVEGYKFALQTTGPQQAIYNAALKDMATSAGTASAQMGERQQGLAFAFNVLKANVRDAGLELSAGFLPSLTRAAQGLTEQLKQPAFRSDIKSLGEDIGRFIDEIDWGKVVGGARAFWEVSKQILTVISRIPPEITASVAAFAGFNKLSGGLIGQGLGNILGGLGEGIARSAGSRLPGVGRLFAQPVFVTNWPVGMGLGGPGGGPGGLGKLGTAVGAIGLTAVAGAAVLAVQQHIAGQTSQQSAGVLTQTQKWIKEQRPTSEMLKNALSGTEKGIQDIKSNPLFSVVGGNEALTNLERTKATLQDQLLQTAGAEAQRRLDEQRLREGVNSGLARVENAWRTAQFPTPVTVLNVSVSPSGAYGTATTSYQRGGTQADGSWVKRAGGAWGQGAG